MTYALITGGSKGIGKALAHELASKGYHLLLISRSPELLKAVGEEIQKEYNVKVYCYAIDLNEPDAVDKIRQWCLSNDYAISILINNAGFGLWGKFEHLPLEDQINMMTLNMNVVVRLTYEMLPLLRKNPKSYILNVSSTASYQAVPTLSIYAATKAFVLLFSRGLRQELMKSTTSVSCLSPGATSTEFMDRAGMHSLKATAQKFEMSPAAVARIGIKGLFAKKAEIIPGFINYLTAKLTAFTPKSITEKIAANLYKTPDHS